LAARCGRSKFFLSRHTGARGRTGQSVTLRAPQQLAHALGPDGDAGRSAVSGPRRMDGCASKAPVSVFPPAIRSGASALLDTRLTRPDGDGGWRMGRAWSKKPGTARLRYGQDRRRLHSSLSPGRVLVVPGHRQHHHRRSRRWRRDKRTAASPRQASPSSAWHAAKSPSKGQARARYPRGATARHSESRQAPLHPGPSTQASTRCPVSWVVTDGRSSPLGGPEASAPSRVSWRPIVGIVAVSCLLCGCCVAPCGARRR